MMWIAKGGQKMLVDPGTLPYWESLGWQVDADANAVGDLTQQSAAYKPLTGHPQLVGYIGDSRMNRGSNGTTYRLGYDFMSQACVRSKQAVRYGSKQGVDGDTTVQMLARLPGLLTTTSVDGSGFAGCGAIVVLGGTNDWGNIAASAITMAAVKANIVAMVAAIKAAGKLPVLCTETPRTAASGYQGYVDDFNSWITYYAAANGLPLVDLFSVLVNPSNGQLAAAYDSGDNIHPNAVGMGVMADAVSAVLTRELHTSPLWLPGRSGDTQDLLAGAGLFLTNTGGLGTGWSNFSGGTAPTLTTPAATLGNWQQIDRASAATGNALLQWSTGSGFTIGSTYLAVGRIQTTGIAAGGSNVTVQVTYNGNAAEADPVYLWTNDIPDGVFAIPFTIPSGVTTVKLSLQVGASPSGAVMARISQAGIRNLTAEGF